MDNKYFGLLYKFSADAYREWKTDKSSFFAIILAGILVLAVAVISLIAGSTILYNLIWLVVHHPKPASVILIGLSSIVLLIIGFVKLGKMMAEKGY